MGWDSYGPAARMTTIRQMRPGSRAGCCHRHERTDKDSPRLAGPDGEGTRNGQCPRHTRRPQGLTADNARWPSAADALALGKAAGLKGLEPQVVEKLK